MALIADDAAIEITIGTQAPGGGAITWGAANTMTGLAKNINTKDRVDMINTKSLGIKRKRFRADAGESDITIDQIVDIVGVYYWSGGTLVGRPIRVRFKELSTFSAFKEFIGLIESWEWSARDGEEQAENISIKGDIDAQ